MLTSAVLAALATLLAIVLLSGPELSATLNDLAQAPDHAQAHIDLLVTLVGGPLVGGLVAALVMSRIIWAVRITRYMRFIRSYCRDRLRRDAPLISLGIQPAASQLDMLPERSQREPLSATALLDAHPKALLLGAAGAGKTTALLTIAQSMCGRSALGRVLFGVRRESLPVLVSAPGLARSIADANDSSSVVPYIAAMLARLGTNGLGARADSLLRSGRVALLCDDYDKLYDDERDLINAALQPLVSGPYSRCRLIVTCETSVHASIMDDLGPLASASPMTMAPVPIAELTRALRKRQGKRQRAKEKSGAAQGPLVTDMQDRPLGASLQSAAISAALTETIGAGERVPWGRATLLRAYITLASATAAVRDLESAAHLDGADLQRQPALVWAALAASLQEARSAYLPLDPSRTAGESVLDWLDNNPPPGPTDFALSVAPDLSLQRIERDIQAGLRTGMLRRSLDGLTLGFAHTLAQISAAAWWLDMRDDGLGRLNSQLLRPHWAAPVVLWAGAADDPYDLAQRIFRFANSPDSIAPRVGMADSQDVYPQTIALALAAVVEGVAPQIAHMIARHETETPAFMVRQQGLRDLLDAAVVYGADPQRRARLTRAFERVQQEAGREFISAASWLARESDVDRLLRAQLATALGLSATDEALEALMSLLTQSDPTMRQAVEQALVYADARAIPALQEEVRGANPQTRRRAEEALRLLTGATPGAGEAASGAALVNLSSPDAAQRRVAVTTLSAIGASGALNELIARLDDVNGDVRLAAANALGQLGGKRALLALRKHASSADPHLRLAIAQALGADPTPASAPALIRLLKDRDASVRAAAATALGALADKRAIGPLREASEDVDPWVRHAAQTAVKRYTRS
jgi:HEAT repeat protein